MGASESKSLFNDIMDVYGLKNDKEAKNWRKMRLSQLKEINQNTKNAENNIGELTHHGKLQNTGNRNTVNNAIRYKNGATRKKEKIIEAFKTNMKRIAKTKKNK